MPNYIDVKMAVNAAIQYVVSFGDLINTRELRLEETEFDEKSEDWLVTLSFSESPITTLRSYKLFRVSALDARVKSMTTRTSLAIR